jgi:alkyl hydroperoxide reductase subunit D
MTIQDLKNKIPDYAKDTKLNLGKVLSEEGAPDLKLNQVYGIALASAYASKNADIIDGVYNEARAVLSDAEIHAAKAAASIMAMNNVYYRSLHLISDKEYSRMPANLRMQIIGNPGIEKADFELYSLAVSAINGCGMCLDSHAQEVLKAGISKLGVQTAIRIAAVINAASQALTIETVHAVAGLSNAA